MSAVVPVGMLGAGNDLVSGPLYGLAVVIHYPLEASIERWCVPPPPASCSCCSAGTCEWCCGVITLGDAPIGTIIELARGSARARYVRTCDGWECCVEEAPRLVRFPSPSGWWEWAAYCVENRGKQRRPELAGRRTAW